MLTRVARRRARLRLPRHAVASYEQLQLPWLCPAVARCINQQRQSSSRPSLESCIKLKPQKRASSSDQQPIRQLATAAEHAPPQQYTLLDEYVPFEESPAQGQPDQKQERSTPYLSRLGPFDSQNLVMLPTAPNDPSPEFRRAPMSSLSGDLADLQQNLYACVRVGRHDRAAALVRRIAHLYESDSPELIDAHHQYMTGLLDSHSQHPTKQKFIEMQKWFELDIRGRGVPPSGAIIAILIKASLSVLDGTRLQRTIRRYLNVAFEYGQDTEADVFASSIFTDKEFAKITGMFPARFDNSKDDLSALDQETFREVQYIDAGPMPTAAPFSEANLPSFSESDLPEPTAVRQKGLGLTSLKQSLESMSDANQRGEDAYARQHRLEQDVLASALEKWKSEAENLQEFKSQHQLTKHRLGSHVYKWVQEMSALVQEEIARAEKVEKDKQVSKEDADRLLISPFLKFVAPEKLCAASIMGYVDGLSDRSRLPGTEQTMAAMVSSIATKVTREIKLESIQARLGKHRSLPSAKRRERLLAMIRHGDYRGSEIPQSREEQSGQETPAEIASQGLELTASIKSKIGAFFLSLFMKVAKLPVTRRETKSGQKITQAQPVAVKSIRWNKGKRLGIVKTNEELLNRLKDEPVGSFISKHLPMVVKPQDWTKSEYGPYLETKISPVRFKDGNRSQQEYVSVATKRGDMSQVYKGLDVIGQVPWRVNRDLFRVMVEAWNTGEGIAGLAPADPKPEYPAEPDASDKNAHFKWRNMVKMIENEIGGLHSQRCYQNFQLEVARAFLDDTFYTPHNVDFRGRAYPIPPYFNHMGADNVRGLFLFATGKELGPIGLQWLKVHLANKYGYDKESLKDREQFAMDHLDDIFDSAVNPLQGRRWWLTADDPWQCLASCMELKNALDSPYPTKFVSHLPVHQDGTCNGLQHYAALGGDTIGARQVNLLPGDRPADIYSAVADLVREDITEQAANGDKEAQVLDGKIARKIVKQPVMTNVYGVTFFGAKAQVRKQLVDIMPKATLENDINLDNLSRKVATSIFAALSKMFNGAHAIQQWLGDCGARISVAVTPEQIKRIVNSRKADGESEPDGKKAKERRKRLRSLEKEAAKEDHQFKSTIVWTTPLGMPVVQPYREAKYKIIHTNLQELRISESRLSDPVHKRRQLQGFPPNFIHSLDATHMLLSALKCDEIGVTFSSVHDSFWTHAADVPVMNRVLRDAFVRMHTEDVVGRLREEFLARYKGCIQYASVESASPLGVKIRELRREKGTERGFSSPKVKNKAQVDELLEEYERQRLMQSDDPDERATGYEMITPAALLEMEEDSSSLVMHDPAPIRLLGEEQRSSNVRNEEDEGENADIVVPALEAEAVASAEEEAEILDVNAADEEVAEIESAPTKNDSTEAPAKKKAKPARKGKTYLWIPLTFPPAPEKGDFDVGKLKDSQYFFS